MQRFVPIVRRAARSFRGSLRTRLALVVAVASLAGATAGLLPAVVGRTVATIAQVGDAQVHGAFGASLSRMMPEGAGARIVATLLATALVVGVGVLSSQLGSGLAGDLTAALRVELMRSVVEASARAVGEAGASLAKPRLPPGEVVAPVVRAAATPPPEKATAKGAHPPGGKSPVTSVEAQRTAVVQLAVSREAGLVADFAVSLLTSLPQALATMVVLTVELVGDGAWLVLLGGGGLFVASRLLADRASKRVAAARRELQNADAAVFGHLQETLSSLEDLRLWGARGDAVREFAARSYACADARREFSGALAVSGQVKSVFGAMSPLLVVLAVHWSGRTFDAGGVAKLLLLVPLFIGRLEVLDGVRQGLIERGPVLDATLDLFRLDVAPPRADDAIRLDRAQTRGELVFEDVTFTPPGAEKPVLERVSFRVPAGSVVGVCGPSGSGKSTLLRLVLRLDDPTFGRILLDGVDVRRIEPSQLPELFGVLRQTALPLERRVRDNLTVGLSEVPDDGALRAALEAVELHELASTGGARNLDLRVVRNPPNLSGGEARRLLLARMMLGGSAVQLLDEPEAGLPSATAEQLLKAVVRAANGRTHVVVTHAPHLLRSTFNVVLRGGEVVATGTHEELLASSEAYRALLADALKA